MASAPPAGLPPSACTAGITGPGHTLSSRTMAALHTLWMGLVLLGVLGVLQTQAQVQVSLQPNFQQDKVRGSPAQSPRQHRALSREGGTLWGRVVFLGRGEQSGRRRLTTITPVPGPAVIR